MTWQTINLKKLVALLLPTFLRKNTTLAFLEVSIIPLQTLYVDTLYKMQHNCQVISLEKMLNDYFAVPDYDNQNHEATKKVYIEDEFYPPENYFYLDQEFRPSIDYDNIDLWPDEDEAYMTDDENHFDFVIFIPIAYTFVEAQLRAIIDYYKLAGKIYRIELY
jgi:hypothetical protein